MAKKTLIIVESPTKANTIKSFLGSDCKIIASKGHIRTLPEIGMAIDIKHGYKPQYIIDEKKKDVIAQIKAALKDADELILATDEDREGESISWHITEVFKPTIPCRRMVFHEITKKAILEAFNNGRALDMDLVKAQEARRVVDRLYGYTLSPVLWSKLSNKKLSAGRVQSPGLKLIVDRERMRMSHIKTEYWDVRSTFAQGFTARLSQWEAKRVATGKDFNAETGRFMGSSKVRLLSYEDTQVIISALKGDTFRIEDIAEKSVAQHPFPPFMTSTLQQEGNRKLNLSAKDTMKYAQSLYEKGFITYMRTDSLSLSEEGLKAARSAVTEKYGKAFLSDSPRRYSSKSANAQEAHEAIRPAGDRFLSPDETGLTGRELALYTLIYRRTLASQMKDAQKISTTVTVSAGEGVFTSTGTRIEFPGFLKVYSDSSEHTDKDDDMLSQDLPKLEVGQILTLSDLESVRHETKEPGRYSDASLVQELEKLGIGRPSTYASIIDRIIEKNYVVRENNTLIPTFMGFAVVQVLEYFQQYIAYSFTSSMEEDLDEISNGKLEYLDYVAGFYEGPEGLEAVVKKEKESIVPMAVKQINLPGVSEDNTIRIGKFGPYVQDSEGNFYSIPDSWYPANVNDRMLQELKASRKTSTSNPIVGYTQDGRPIFYCTGKFGDYWQIGDISKTRDVSRFSVPKSLIGKEVPVEKILAFFSLPRVVGHTESGEEITANIGKYGPYIKCGADSRTIKNDDEVLTITESEARAIFSTPKAAAAGRRKKTYTSSAKTKTSSAQTKETEIVKDFGVQNGETLDIRSGRYGYYLKHGSKNIRIAPKYQHDSAACSQMSLEEALEYVRKA